MAYAKAEYTRGKESSTIVEIRPSATTLRDCRSEDAKWEPESNRAKYADAGSLDVESIEESDELNPTDGHYSDADKSSPYETPLSRLMKASRREDRKGPRNARG